MVKLPQRGQSTLDPTAMDCRPPNVLRVEPKPITGDRATPSRAWLVRYIRTPLDFPSDSRWDTTVPSGVTARARPRATVPASRAPTAHIRPCIALRRARYTTLTPSPIHSPR